MTYNEMNRAYIAHIYGYAVGSARYDLMLSPQLEKDFTNLMLLCDTHHRLVDDKKRIKEYPTGRLIQMKENHENRIGFLTGTLAAKSYAEQDNIYDALIGILDKMPNHIETRNIGGREVKWVENPVNPLENFADKWEENKRKEENFYQWMDEAKKDITEAFRETGLDRIAERLKAPFGEKVMTEAMNRYGQRLKGKRENGTLFNGIRYGNIGKCGGDKS